MLVSEAVTHAVNEYFDNPGTTADDITPAMQIFWAYEGVMHYWRKMYDQEFGYFQARQNTLAITSGTSVYALPNSSGTTATTSTSMASITKMFLRQGSSDPYTYLLIPPTYPTERYWLKQSNSFFNMSNLLAQSPGFFWSSNVGALSTGAPTLNVEFSPTPQMTGTVVYDGIRYPAKPTAVTDYIDLPDHMQYGVILFMLKQCYIRDKADTTPVDRLIKEFDDDVLNIEKTGMQRDGAQIVKEVR